MTKSITRYRIGTFNVEYGRKGSLVDREIRIGLRDNYLDALVVQEAHDYFLELNTMVGYDYFCGATSASHLQVGILVKQEHNVTKFKAKQAGDGWTTKSGFRHGPVATPQLIVNGKLGLKGLHLPTPSMWIKGKLQGPIERVDDLKATMGQVANWFGNENEEPQVAKVAAGDWNEKPSTKGKFSPGNVAKSCGAKIVTTYEKQPHGNIDYFMVKGDCNVVNCYQDDELKERSDHELRVLVLDV